MLQLVNFDYLLVKNKYSLATFNYSISIIYSLSKIVIFDLILEAKL